MKMDARQSAVAIVAQQDDLERDVMMGKKLPRLALFVARCSGAAMAAWKLSVLLGMCEPVWAALSALIISHARLSDTRLCLRGRILGTLLGIAISLSVNVVASRMHTPLVMQVAVAIGISAAIAAEWPAFRVAMWTCPVVLVATSSATPIVMTTVARGGGVILGALVGLAFHWGAEILIHEFTLRSSSNV